MTGEEKLEYEIFEASLGLAEARIETLVSINPGSLIKNDVKVASAGLDRAEIGLQEAEAEYQLAKLHLTTWEKSLKTFSAQADEHFKDSEALQAELLSVVNSRDKGRILDAGYKYAWAQKLLQEAKQQVDLSKQKFDEATRLCAAALKARDAAVHMCDQARVSLEFASTELKKWVARGTESARSLKEREELFLYLVRRLTNVSGT